MIGLLLLALAATAIAVAVAVRRNERTRRQARAATVDLEADGVGVRRTLADGRHEEVDWTELIEVEVITTRVGVHEDDGAVIVLCGPDQRGCLVPAGLADDAGVLELLTHLPGFESSRLVEAMSAPPPSRMTCWRRPGVGAPGRGPASA